MSSTSIQPQHFGNMDRAYNESSLPKAKVSPVVILSWEMKIGIEKEMGKGEKGKKELGNVL